jgi:hypothetical protein
MSNVYNLVLQYYEIVNGCSGPGHGTLNYLYLHWSVQIRCGRGTNINNRSVVISALQIESRSCTG